MINQSAAGDFYEEELEGCVRTHAKSTAAFLKFCQRLPLITPTDSSMEGFLTHEEGLIAAICIDCHNPNSLIDSPHSTVQAV